MTITMKVPDPRCLLHRWEEMTSSAPAQDGVRIYRCPRCNSTFCRRASSGAFAGDLEGDLELVTSGQMPEGRVALTPLGQVRLAQARAHVQLLERAELGLAVDQLFAPAGAVPPPIATGLEVYRRAWAALQRKKNLHDNDTAPLEAAVATWEGGAGRAVPRETLGTIYRVWLVRRSGGETLRVADAGEYEALTAEEACMAAAQVRGRPCWDYEAVLRRTEAGVMATPSAQEGTTP